MIGLVFNLIYDEARKIWYYRRLLGATSALVFVAAGAYIVAMPTTYESWAQLFIPKETPLSAATAGVSKVGNDYGNPYLIQRIMLNDENLAKVVRQVNPDAASFDRRQMEGATGSLRGRIKVTSDEDADGFIEFRVTDANPVRAQKTTQVLLNQFIADNVNRSRKELAQTSAFLDEQIVAYEKLLEDSQSEIAAFRRQHPSVAAAPVALGDGAAELASARVAYASAQGSAGSGRAATSAPQDGAIADVQASLASLLTQYTEQYPDVVAARRQLANLQAQRAQYLATAPAPAAPANPALAEARQRLAAAQARAQVGRSSQAAPTYTAQWAELQRKQQRLADTYQELVGRREGARLAQAAHGANASGKYQVTHAPTVPLSPVGPNRPLYLAFAALFALAVGVGVAYARAGVTGIFVSARAVEDTFQLPVVGTVSWESAWHVKKSDRKRRALGHVKQRSLPAS